MSVGLNSKLKDEKKDQDLKDEQELDVASSSKLNVKCLIIIAGIAIVAIVLLLSFFNGGNEGVAPDAAPTPIVTADPNAKEKGITDSDGTEGDISDDLAGNDDSFVQGDPNYGDSNNNATSNRIFNENDYVKDLKGADVSAVYTVSNRNYIKTHVSYTAKRAIIDDGMEMYWLDVLYKKKKYRVQVPFYYFKDLEDEGICRVEIEVLNLEGGGQIISYMQVIDESNESDSSY